MTDKLVPEKSTARPAACSPRSVQIRSSSTYLPNRGSLGLLSIPTIFTQDALLDARQFIDRAKELGYVVTLKILQDLHNRRLLLPFYRVSDSPVEGRRMDVQPDVLAHNPVGWVWEAAGEGRLRDPVDEGYSVAWPYECPASEDPRVWWNGFVYSPWQLINIHRALDLRDIAKRLGYSENYVRAAKRRRMTLALAALASTYLPSILGRLSIPPDFNETDLWRISAEVSILDLVRTAGLEPADLRPLAEDLLGQAHIRDPIIKWLPILRHTSYTGWSKLRGEPLYCMWLRVAAEVLLLAHDELTEASHVEPLPDLTGAGWWTPLHDRLTPTYAEADTLERALGDFGLSPYPKVLVLVEGETELNHISRLLATVGLNHPQEVRVQRCKGSNVSPQLIARYNITPRTGRRLGECWLLDATGTAMVIAMDPENRWATAEKRETERRALLDAIREEVRSQGADILQDHLEFLVQIYVWGTDRYELANFTNDELIAAICQLVGDQHDTSSETWLQELRGRLDAARTHHQDIKVPLGQMRINLNKVRLADALWPTLRVKLERELALDRPETPVVELVTRVRHVYAQISSVRAMAVPDGFE